MLLIDRVHLNMERDMRGILRLIVVLIVGLLAVMSFAAAQDNGNDEAPAAVQPGAGGTYVVQYGDTLDVLAQAFNISLESLKLANDIPRVHILRPGDTLVIPANAPPYGAFPALDMPRDDIGVGGGVDGELYVVQPRDTLDVIAQTFDISLESLKLANDIPGRHILRPGTTLIIPAGAPPYGTFPALDMPRDDIGVGGGVDGELYVVQPGNTLDVIAQTFNVSLEALKIANDIPRRHILRPGTTLIIPAGAPPYGMFPALDRPGNGDGVGGGVDGELHIIQPRETIDGISAFYNVSTRCVIEANQITNTRRIFPGQTLVIPAGCPPYIGAAIPGGTQATGVVPAVPPAAPETDEGEAPPTGDG
jgi:LysM repeat protein